MLSPPLFIQGSLLNVEIVVLNYQKCNQCRKGHTSPGLLFRGNGWYITTFTHGSCIWLFWAEVHWFKNLEFLPFCLFGGLCRPKNLVSGPCRSQGLQRAPGACGPEGLKQSFPTSPYLEHNAQELGLRRPELENKALVAHRKESPFPRRSSAEHVNAISPSV